MTHRVKALLIELFVTLFVDVVLLSACFIVMLAIAQPLKYSTFALISLEVLLLVIIFYVFCRAQEGAIGVRSWFLLFGMDLLAYIILFSEPQFFFSNMALIKYPYVYLLPLICILVAIIVGSNFKKVPSFYEKNKRVIKNAIRTSFWGFICHAVSITCCLLISFFLCTEAFPIVLGVLFSLIILAIVAIIVTCLEIDSFSVIGPIALVSLGLCIFIVYPFFHGLGTKFIGFILKNELLFFSLFYLIGSVIGQIFYVKKFDIM